MNRDNDKITRLELHTELRNRYREFDLHAEHAGAAAFTNAIVNNIISRRGHALTDGDNCHPMTFTEDELEQAFIRRGYTSSIHSSNLVKDILDHREPEWETGALVRDANGGVYRRRPDRRWESPGSPTIWAEGRPRRPLKRLVEES